MSLLVCFCIFPFHNNRFINWFISDQNTLADKYSLEITPPGWAFSIWGIIYTWQALWLLYILYHSIIWRAQLTHTLTFGTVFYISWIASCIFNGSWILLFSFEYITISTVVLILISVALYVNAYSNHKYIGLASEYNPNDDASNNTLYPMYILNQTVIVLYRILLLNGITFYATWTSIAQCLNIAIFLTYVANVYSNTASLVALAILNVVLLVYWFLDFYYLRKWLVYTYSPYAVLLWALGAISTNPNEGDLALKGATRVYVYVLIAMVAVATVCKIISGILYAMKPQKSELPQYSNVGGTNVDV